MQRDFCSCFHSDKGGLELLAGAEPVPLWSCEREKALLRLGWRRTPRGHLQLFHGVLLPAGTCALWQFWCVCEIPFSSRVCFLSGWKFFSSRSVSVAVQLRVGSEGILQALKPLGNPCWQNHAPGSHLLLKCPSQKGWGSPLKL